MLVRLVGRSNFLTAKNTVLEVAELSHRAGKPVIWYAGFGTGFVFSREHGKTLVTGGTFPKNNLWLKDLSLGNYSCPECGNRLNVYHLFCSRCNKLYNMRTANFEFFPEGKDRAVSGLNEKFRAKAEEVRTTILALDAGELELPEFDTEDFISRFMVVGEPKQLNLWGSTTRRLMDEYIAGNRLRRFNRLLPISKESGRVLEVTENSITLQDKNKENHTYTGIGQPMVAKDEWVREGRELFRLIKPKQTLEEAAIALKVDQAKLEQTICWAVLENQLVERGEELFTPTWLLRDMHGTGRPLFDYRNMNPGWMKVKKPGDLVSSLRELRRNEYSPAQESGVVESVSINPETACHEIVVKQTRGQQLKYVFPADAKPRVKPGERVNQGDILIEAELVVQLDCLPSHSIFLVGQEKPEVKRRMISGVVASKE